MQMKNEIGNTHGRLTVFARAESNNSAAMWKCKCSCGNTTIVRGADLRNKKIKSCGCLKNETTSIIFKTHGLSNIKLYDVWIKMKSRCKNKNDKDYSNYGGRGIKVIDSWENNFKNFYEWSIKNGYKEKLTIERIDVNGNYDPENCTFIKNELQSLNRRNTKKYTYKNETKDTRYFSEKYNINYYTLRTRLIKYNWCIEKAIETISVKGRNQYGIKNISN